MPLELETKLRVPDRLTMERLLSDAEIFDAQISEMRAVAMQAFYYDTAKDILNERKWTLRIRREDGVSIGVFKSGPTVEDSVFTREELSCAADTIEEAVPLLVGLGAPPELLDMQPFVERCRIEFTRTVCCLRLEDGSACEFAADDGVIYADEKSEPMLEMELELLSGPPDAMTELAVRLKERYSLQKEQYSKYGRALRLLRSRAVSM